MKSQKLRGKVLREKMIKSEDSEENKGYNSKIGSDLWQNSVNGVEK